MKMGKRLLSFILMALFAALLLSGLVMAQEGVGLPITFVKYFTGTIDGKYSIEMVLSRSGSQLSGRYYYAGQQKDLELYGQMDSAGNLFLEETGEEGKTTGLFRGKFVTGSQVKGKWIRPDGTQSLGFVLEENFAPSPRWDAWKAEQEAIPTLPPEVTLVGTISGTLGIHMRLNIQGGEVTGSYYYDSRKMDIPVKGVIRGGRLLLTEFGETGKVTGRFEASCGGRVDGFWISPDESRILPWHMEEYQASAEYENPWEGEWSREGNGDFEVAYLTITDVTSTGFHFEGNSTSGMHVGELEGFAESVGVNQAVWENEDRDGAIRFTLQGEVLNVEEKGDLGLGAGFMGKYRRDGSEYRPTFQQIGVFDNEKQETAFVKLVGPDEYDAFMAFFSHDE